ncbi:MAG TPA: hypothetical protein PL196_05265, partial [Burkholderiaceae bacterium]|nr:hypothetical protein [Burkholderiaceae bacterium]
EAIMLARETGNRYFLAANVCNLGAIRLRRGEWQLARELLDEGNRLCRDAGLSSVASIAEANLGAALLGLGSIAAARRHLGQVAERARHLGLVSLELNCERDLARAAIAEGQGGEARARLQRMLALARPDALASDQLRALAVYAELLTSEGADALAADAWRHALDQPQLDATSRAEAIRRLAALDQAGASPGSGARATTLDDWVARMLAETVAAVPGNAGETPGR